MCLREGVRIFTTEIAENTESRIFCRDNLMLAAAVGFP